jgi:hypothetical protein
MDQNKLMLDKTFTYGRFLAKQAQFIVCCVSAITPLRAAGLISWGRVFSKFRNYD